MSGSSRCGLMQRVAKGSREILLHGVAGTDGTGTVVGRVLIVGATREIPLVFQACASISGEIGDIRWRRRASAHATAPCA